MNRKTALATIRTEFGKHGRHTPASVRAYAESQTNQTLYASNIESRIAAIQDLGSGVKDMNKLLKKFGGR